MSYCPLATADAARERAVADRCTRRLRYQLKVSAARADTASAMPTDSAVASRKARS